MAMGEHGHNGLRKATYVRVEDLAPTTSGHNLVVKVHANTVVLDKERLDGTTIKLSECIIGE
jgi:hypothetical protein